MPNKLVIRLLGIISIHLLTFPAFPGTQCIVLHLMR